MLPVRDVMAVVNGWIGWETSSSDKKDQPPVEAALDPEVAAQQAQLRYVDDAAPGITRQKARNGFDYRLPDGVLVRDIDTLKRIRSLGRNILFEPRAGSTGTSA